MAEDIDADEVELSYKNLLENAPDALVLVSAAGLILYVNAQAEKLFGYAKDELLGQLIEILVPERYRPIHAAHRETYAMAPKLRPMGLHLSHLAGLRKDGTEFLAEINLAPLPGAAVVVAVRQRVQGEMEWEREREREHERAQAREREAEREHERAQGRARARKLKGLSIPTAIVIVVAAQIAFNLILYLIFARP